jgi:hypothetical protein
MSEIYSGEGLVNSGFPGELNREPLPGGPAYGLTFDTAGEFPYFCVLHASGPEGSGVVGTITVRKRARAFTAQSAPRDPKGQGLSTALGPA